MLFGTENRLGFDEAEGGGAAGAKPLNGDSVTGFGGGGIDVDGGFGWNSDGVEVPLLDESEGGLNKFELEDVGFALAMPLTVVS